MIGFIRRWLHNRYVQPKLDAQRDQWKQVFDDLSRAQEQERTISGAISRETYESRVVKHIGNTTLTQQDTPHTTAFKLGVQHAMRQFEKECVL